MGRSGDATGRQVMRRGGAGDHGPPSRPGRASAPPVTRSASSGATTSTIPSPRLNVANMSSSVAPLARSSQPKTGGSSQLPRRSSAPRPGGSARGRFSTNPPPVMCAAAWSSPSRCSARTCGAWIRHGSSSSSASGRPSSGTDRRQVHVRDDPPHEGVAVRVQAARREPHEDVALPHAVGAEQVGLPDRPDAEPGQVERVLGHHAGMFGGLASEERAPGPSAPLGDALDDRGDPLGDDPADRQVVEEEQRLGAGAHDVVGAHRDEIDPDRVEAAGAPRDLQLRPDAVGGGGEQRVVARAEQPREPTHRVGHLGAPRARGEVGDQGDGFGGRLGVDAGGAVGLAHPVGSRS